MVDVERAGRSGHGAVGVDSEHIAEIILITFRYQCHPASIVAARRFHDDSRRCAMPKAAETVEIAGITLTHPDRVLWPDQGVTKRALAEYYADIADRILPHVVNRPLTLVRCPSGSDGACFVQKHPCAGLHKSVRRIRSGVEEWVAVDDATGLVALVQMGVLELPPGEPLRPTSSGRIASLLTSTRMRVCRARTLQRAKRRSTGTWMIWGCVVSLRRLVARACTWLSQSSRMAI